MADTFHHQQKSEKHTMIDNEIVTANARVFPLIEDTPSPEPLFSDRDSQLEIDSLTPYVDLARMARERYDNNPSIANGAKMSKDRNELATRMKRAANSLCGRYPGTAQEDALNEMMKRFPALKYVFQGGMPND